jgi:hypothetical protein
VTASQGAEVAELAGEIAWWKRMHLFGYNCSNAEHVARSFKKSIREA